jgi:hypothetical protein
MRWPRMHGLPWQIAGSITMRSRSCSCVIGYASCCEVPDIRLLTSSTECWSSGAPCKDRHAALEAYVGFGDPPEQCLDEMGCPTWPARSASRSFNAASTVIVASGMPSLSHGVPLRTNREAMLPLVAQPRDASPLGWTQIWAHEFSDAANRSQIST